MNDLITLLFGIAAGVGLGAIAVVEGTAILYATEVVIIAILLLAAYQHTRAKGGKRE